MRCVKIREPSLMRRRYVSVNFDAGQSWWDELLASGFDASKPAMVASTGVSMYLERAANLALLRQIARLAPTSTLAMTLLLPLALVAAEDRSQHRVLHERAGSADTPFLSLFGPRKCWRWPTRPVFKRRRTCPRAIKFNATSRTERMVSNRPTASGSWWRQLKMGTVVQSHAKDV